MPTGTDLRGVENRIDQPRPSGPGQLASLDVEGSPNLQPVHNLDVGLGHTPPIVVLDSNPAPITPKAAPAQASAAMPVMTMAEASTIPTWKAAEPSS